MALTFLELMAVTVFCSLFVAVHARPLPSSFDEFSTHEDVIDALYSLLNDRDEALISDNAELYDDSPRIALFAPRNSKRSGTSAEVSLTGGDEALSSDALRKMQAAHAAENSLKNYKPQVFKWG